MGQDFLNELVLGDKVKLTGAYKMGYVGIVECMDSATMCTVKLIHSDEVVSVKYG